MKKVLALVLALGLTISLVACGNKNNESTNASSGTEKQLTFKVGGIGPVTGGAAIYGQAVRNGIQIAVDEINSKGGINGFNVDFHFEDDEHDSEKAINAYNSLKDWGMQMLIGTTTSSPCIAVADRTKKDGMFQITPSGSAVECTANDNVFRVCFSDPNQGKASAEYIKTNNLGSKVGVIYDSSDVYSNGIYESFLEEANSIGLTVVAEEQFTADSKTDFTTQLTKIKNAGADLVFLPFYYSEAALVLSQARDMAFSPIWFSCDGMDGILTLENFDKSLAEGVMLLTPFSADATDSLTTNFVNEYKNRYGEVPNQFAADSYDAMYILKAACEAGNVSPSESYSSICNAIKSAMTKITLNGLTGDNMKWSADGEPNKEPKAVVIENGEYKLHK